MTKANQWQPRCLGYDMEGSSMTAIMPSYEALKGSQSVSIYHPNGFLRPKHLMGLKPHRGLKCFGARVRTVLDSSIFITASSHNR